MPNSHRNIAAELRKRIAAGVYGTQAPIPSERALESEFQAHRATIRRAIQQLSSEGLVNRLPGRRAFAERHTAPAQGNIGLYAAAPNDSYTRSLIANGIAEYLLEKGSRNGLIWSNSSAFQLGASIGDVPEPYFDTLVGLVLWPPNIVDAELLHRFRRRIPVAVVDNRIPGFESDFVGFQDIEAGYAAAQHLYQLGHRRITFIGDLVPETVRFRRFGLDRFCQEVGIQAAWPWAAYGGSILALPDLLDCGLARTPRSEWPTAAVCANDETACAVMAALGPIGLKVPDDLALIGFGNAQPALLTALGLSSMNQPYEQMGREAAAMLLDRIGRELLHRSAREVRLPMELVVRTSCGAGRSAVPQN